MVIVIASALIETLTKHMFQKYLNEKDKVEIGGAPSWYEKPIDDRVCVFTNVKGGLSSIDTARDDAKIKMAKTINGLVEITIHDNYKKIKNEKEKEVVEQWKTDSNLPIFVNKNIDFSRVVYEDKLDITFVRACVDKKTIIKYQSERLSEIKKAVLKHKTKSAMQEMDNSIKGTSKSSTNDSFGELDAETKR